jgi:hypothetical protein
VPCRGTRAWCWVCRPQAASTSSPAAASRRGRSTPGGPSTSGTGRRWCWPWTSPVSPTGSGPPSRPTSWSPFRTGRPRRCTRGWNGLRRSSHRIHGCWRTSCSARTPPLSPRSSLSPRPPARRPPSPTRRRARRRLRRRQRVPRSGKTERPSTSVRILTTIPSTCWPRCRRCSRPMPRHRARHPPVWRRSTLARAHPPERAASQGCRLPRPRLARARPRERPASRRRRLRQRRLDTDRLSRRPGSPSARSRPDRLARRCRAPALLHLHLHLPPRRPSPRLVLRRTRPVASRRRTRRSSPHRTSRLRIRSSSPHRTSRRRTRSSSPHRTSRRRTRSSSPHRTSRLRIRSSGRPPGSRHRIRHRCHRPGSRRHTRHRAHLRRHSRPACIRPACPGSPGRCPRRVRRRHLDRVRRRPSAGGRS